MGRKKFYAGVLLVSCALALCGCGSTQEKDASSVLVSANGTSSYEMARVQRERLQKTKVIVANYQQVKSENLSFSVDGRRLAGVYVSLGDSVTKGELLAELFCDEEKESLANMGYQIKTQEMKIEHLKEQKELELAQLERKKSSMSAGGYKNRVDALEDEYRLQIEDIEDSIYITRLRYDELHRWIEGCKIYAGMDGTVTYITDTGSGFVSWGGRKVMTVSDSAECAFICNDIEYAEYFTVGETYVFETSSGTKYETILTGVDDTQGAMFFELKVPQYDMALGQRVLYSLILEEKEDALSIPKSAVHYVGDVAYVYYFDENRNRQVKQIEVGLGADSKIEVLSGLGEGEEVILR